MQRSAICEECLSGVLRGYDTPKAAADIQALMDGRDAEILHRCVTCCACREYCPTGADPFDLILRAMEEKKTFPAPPGTTDMFALAGQLPTTVIPGDADKPVLSLCVMEASLPPGALDGEMFRPTVARGGDYFCYVGHVHAGQEARGGARPAGHRQPGGPGEGHRVPPRRCYAMVDAKIRDYDQGALPVCTSTNTCGTISRTTATASRPREEVASPAACASRYTPAKDAFSTRSSRSSASSVPAVTTAKRSAAQARSCGSIRPCPRDQTRNIDDAVAFGADALVTPLPHVRPGAPEAGSSPGPDEDLRDRPVPDGPRGDPLPGDGGVAGSFVRRISIGSFFDIPDPWGCETRCSERRDA